METTNLETIDVLTLLPQRPPFVMIDALTSLDETTTTSRLTVRPDNLFVEADGTLNPCALIENMAQTCAARLGYVNTYINKGPVRLGFIGGIKHLEVLRPARLGETLTTHVAVVQEVLQTTLVHCTVSVGSEVIAAGDLKIAMTDIKAADDE